VEKNSSNGKKTNKETRACLKGEAMKVYDTASAIYQIDCNEWVKLQDVEALLRSLEVEL
jgi:hypothetical protein